MKLIVDGKRIGATGTKGEVQTQMYVSYYTLPVIGLADKVVLENISI